jgi:hypothetical protein
MKRKELAKPPQRITGDLSPLHQQPFALLSGGPVPEFFRSFLFRGLKHIVAKVALCHKSAYTVVTVNISHQRKGDLAIGHTSVLDSVAFLQNLATVVERPQPGVQELVSSHRHVEARHHLTTHPCQRQPEQKDGGDDKEDIPECKELLQDAPKCSESFSRR